MTPEQVRRGRELVAETAGWHTVSEWEGEKEWVSVVDADGRVLAGAVRDSFPAALASLRTLLAAALDEREADLDVSQEIRLASMRVEVERASPQYGGWASAYARDVGYLLAALTGSHSVLADLLSDPSHPASAAREAGAAEERRRCARAILDAARTLGRDLTEALGAIVDGMPDLPPPLAPESARRRADQFESALREIASMWEAGGSSRTLLLIACQTAKKALGEDPNSLQV